MSENNSYTRVLLPVSFFGALVAILMLGESFGPTSARIVTVTPEAGTVVSPAPEEELPRCDENSDCPLPTTFCNAKGRCEQLKKPVCDCSQKKVLRCKEEDSEKARFIYCPTACVATGGGAICQ